MDDLIRRAHAAFDIIDTSDDGEISVAELTFSARRSGVCNNLFTELKLFSAIDEDGDAIITRDEFVSAVSDPNADPILVRLLEALVRERLRSVSVTAAETNDQEAVQRVAQAREALLTEDGAICLRIRRPSTGTRPPAPPQRLPSAAAPGAGNGDGSGSDYTTCEDEDPDSEEESEYEDSNDAVVPISSRDLLTLSSKDDDEEDPLWDCAFDMAAIVHAKRAADRWSRLARRGRSMLVASISLGDDPQAAVGNLPPTAAAIVAESTAAAQDSSEEAKGLAKFQRIRAELIETEHDYHEDLRIITDAFQQPLQTVAEYGDPIMEANDIQLIFRDVEVLKNISQELLDQLNNPSIDDPARAVAVPLLELQPFFKMYSDYCSRYLNSLNRLRELREGNEELDLFLHQKQQSPFCRGLDLADYLIKPVQRICKYPLFLRDMLKCKGLSSEGRTVLESAASKMHELNTQVNHFVTNCEAAVEFVSVCRRIDHIDMIVPTRTLFASDVVQLLDQRQTAVQRLMIIFTDLVVFARERRTTDRLKITHVLHFNTITISPRLPPHLVESLVSADASRKSSRFSLRRSSRSENVGPDPQTLLHFMAGNDLVTVICSSRAAMEHMEAALIKAKNEFSNMTTSTEELDTTVPPVAGRWFNRRRTTTAAAPEQSELTPRSSRSFFRRRGSASVPSPAPRASGRARQAQMNVQLTHI